MKRKRNSLKSSQQIVSPTETITDLHLPDDCWESIFKFLIGDNHHYLEPLSVVSKQFLSISNCLRFTLTISDATLPFLPRLFDRFPNLTSLQFKHFSGDLDSLLCQISTCPLKLKSLKFSNQSTIPAKGLRVFSKYITTVTSLTCCNIDSLHESDMVLISNCFPFLEELDLSNPKKFVNVVGKAMLLKLPKLRKVILSGHHWENGSLLLHLCKSCEFLQEIVMFNNNCILNDDINSAIRERPGLRSISFTRRNFGNVFIESLVSLKGLTCLDLSYSFISDQLLSSVAEKGLPIKKLVLQGCVGYTYVGIYNLLSKCQFIQHLDLQNANFMTDEHVVKLSSFLGDLVSINISNCASLNNVALFALLRSCAKLTDVKMEYTSIGKMSVENSYTLMDFDVYSELKSLHLAHNRWLRDEDINMFSSVCPNIQLLDLSACNGISKEGIGQVLRKSSKIRHLNIAYCSRLKQLKLDFKVSTLVVLNLSKTGIYDKSFDMISTSCFALLHLDLGHCYNVTEKGVMKVVENCTQPREINLHGCGKVVADVVDSMVFIRPSLRKITAPPCFCCTDSKRELFLRHGCLVC